MSARLRSSVPSPERISDLAMIERTAPHPVPLPLGEGTPKAALCHENIVPSPMGEKTDEGRYARSWPVQGERKETGVCVVIPVLNEEEAMGARTVAPSASTSAASSVASGAPRGPGAGRRPGTPAGSALPPGRCAPASRAPRRRHRRARRCRSRVDGGAPHPRPTVVQGVDDRREQGGVASGRAASWTTTTSASGGTAASPARTDSDRVAPPGDRPRRPRAVPRGRPHRRAGPGRRRRTPRGTPRRTRRPPGGRRAARTAWAPRSAGPRPRRRPPPRRCRPATGRLRQGVVEALLGRLLVDAQGEGQLGDEDLAGPDSMRFSPADRPLSLSRIERFRTTSATW